MNKKLIAVIVFELCAIPYVVFAPFEPVSFFSLLAIAIIGAIWAIIWLGRTAND